jgi:hypothetical protein
VLASGIGIFSLAAFQTNSARSIPDFAVETNALEFPTNRRDFAQKTCTGVMPNGRALNKMLRQRAGRNKLAAGLARFSLLSTVRIDALARFESAPRLGEG